MRRNFNLSPQAQAAAQITLPKALRLPELIMAKPFFSQYLRDPESSAARIRAISALRTCAAKSTDTATKTGIDELCETLKLTPEEKRDFLGEEALSTSKSAEDHGDGDEKVESNPMDRPFGLLKRLHLRYKAKKLTDYEFEATKEQSAGALHAVAEYVDTCSMQDLDRVLHQFLPLYCRAFDRMGMDRLVSYVKFRSMQFSGKMQWHTVARLLRMLLKQEDKDELFRAKLTKDILRTLPKWSYVDTLLGFKSLVLAENFNDATVFADMLEHMQSQAKFASPPAVSNTLKLLRANDIRHSGLIEGLVENVRANLNIFSVAHLVNVLEALNHLQHVDEAFIPMAFDRISHNLNRDDTITWVLVARVAILCEKAPHETEGRRDLAFSLGRYNLKRMKSAHDDTMDVIRTLAWEHRKE